MTIKNKYSNRAKISERKIRENVKLFAIDLKSSQITQLTNLNRNTFNRYLPAIRKEIFESYQKESPFEDEVEVDESFFGARRIKRKRGRGASGKTIVFGIIKRQGKVYTEIVPACSKTTLQTVIRGKVSLDSVIHTDCWRGYIGLVDLGFKKHFRVSHRTNEFANPKSHINGIESFGALLKPGCLDSEVCIKVLFFCISKSVSLGLITEMKISIN